MRIELTTKAWEAFVLPLNYARIVLFDFTTVVRFVKRIEEFAILSFVSIDFVSDATF